MVRNTIPHRNTGMIKDFLDANSDSWFIFHLSFIIFFMGTILASYFIEISDDDIFDLGVFWAITGLIQTAIGMYNEYRSNH